MKTHALVICTCVLTLGGAAAPLQNVGFENANTNNVSTGSGIDFFGPPSEMVPGWQIIFETTPETRVGLNAFLPGSGYSSLMTPNNRDGLPVEGNYSLALIPRFNTPNLGDFTPYGVFQSAEIPSNAKSIHFVSYGQPVNLYVNGSLVPIAYTYRPGNVNPNTQLADASGDISSYAGLNVELKFVTPNQTLGRIYGLDSISFSDIAIPEPSTLALLFLGALVLAARLRRR